MTPGGSSLSYDAAPSFATPLRFFLTAPVFGIAAGILLVLMPGLLDSRWTPGALAITHLITVGFMLMIMVGAMFQILPVVIGASLPRADLLASIVHVCLAAGTITLSWGLGSMNPDILFAAVVLLGSGSALFLAAASHALWRAPISQASQRDMRLALISLAIAIMLGLALAMVLARGVPLPLLSLLKLHVGWAWLGGAGILLAATSWVVVPMFQITPAYPTPITRYWGLTTCAALIAWSAGVLLGVSVLESMLVLVLIVLAAVFVVTTLRLQLRSRRSTPDATFRMFQFGMLNVSAGIACVLAAQYWDSPVLPVLAGVLVLYGGFVSIIEGMLYKIVPFLAWLHLIQDGIKAPNMRKLQPDNPVWWQTRSHMIAVAALVIAIVAGHETLIRICGLLVAFEFAWLVTNLLRVVRAYRAARPA
jgi:hypothetical protein